MIKIELPKNKHIGLIFDPRSGSHAFRNYISSTLTISNLSEFLNPQVNPLHISVDKNKKVIYQYFTNDVEKNPKYELFNNTNINHWANEKFNLLDDMTHLDIFGIFGIMIRNTLSSYPEIIKKIKERSDIYFIRSKRADVLYSIISIEISKHTTIWHNTDDKNTFSRVNIKDKFDIPVNTIKKHLEMYIKCENLIEEIFDEMPVIYYEQWQNNIRNLNKILTLPNKLVSIGYQKFSGNYKNLISNIDDIENYYEKFVNEHPEYFPQYFGKLPEIKIPELQGRQPNQFHEFH